MCLHFVLFGLHLDIWYKLVSALLLEVVCRSRNAEADKNEKYPGCGTQLEGSVEVPAIEEALVVAEEICLYANVSFKVSSF